MVRKTWLFLTLTLVGLNLGAAFAHLLEMPGKMALDGPDYLKVQEIYRGFGPVGRWLEPGSVLAAAVGAIPARGRQPAFALSRIGAASLGAALATWLTLINPMNIEFAKWTPSTIPPDWQRTRNQWEYAYAARFWLQLAGFCALLLAALSDEPPKHSEVRPAAPVSS